MLKAKEEYFGDPFAMSCAAETALLDADRVALLCDLLPVGACILDDELSIHLWNAKLEEWTGLSKDEALGANLSTLFPNVKEPRYYDRLRQVFSTGMPATYSASLHKHFLPVPVRHGLKRLSGDQMVQQTEIRLYSQDPKLAFVTIQDVSFQYGQLGQLRQERLDLVAVKNKLEATNRQLKRRNAELDDFCYVASHDLQEPLRKIVSFGQLLEREYGDKIEGEGQKYLDFMSTASRRMRQLIGDLLVLSRAGQSELDLGVVSVSDCVDAAFGNSGDAD